MKALLLPLFCLLLLAVACGGEPSESDSSSTAGASSADSANPALGPDILPPDTAPQSSTQALPDRLIVSTNIELGVADLRDAYVEISGYARGYGGFVAEAHLDDDGDEGSAFLRLRVPSSNHDQIVADVRDFPNAELQSEESTAKEVTEEYVDLQARLANLRETEAQYHELLDRTGSVEEVLPVTTKLEEVRSDIERLEGRINLLEDRIDYASVAVRLATLPPAPVAEASDGPTSPIEVLEGASETSLTVALAFLNIAIVLFVIALWVIPAALIAILARRYLRGPVASMKTWLE